MNNSFFGILLKVDSDTLKFLANTSLGVCASQSVIKKVWNSSKLPSSNTSRNLHPSGPKPWMECGTPGGKSQRSPSPTSLTKLLPSWSTAVMRAFPYSIIAHSAVICQWSSRTPPAVNRISTPAIVFEIGNSLAVTCRVQPPLSIRFLARENEYLNGGTVPLSVSGAQTESGFSASSAAFFGPGSFSLGRWWSEEWMFCLLLSPWVLLICCA